MVYKLSEFFSYHRAAHSKSISGKFLDNRPVLFASESSGLPYEVKINFWKYFAVLQPIGKVLTIWHLNVLYQSNFIFAQSCFLRGYFQLLHQFQAFTSECRFQSLSTDKPVSHKRMLHVKGDLFQPVICQARRLFYRTQGVKNNVALPVCFLCSLAGYVPNILSDSILLSISDA